MPDKVSFLKARYCRAVLRTALNSPEEDARRLVYCLATETPTASTATEINIAEREALDALQKLAPRIEERGVAALSTYWKEVNDVIAHWIETAHQADTPQLKYRN